MEKFFYEARPYLFIALGVKAYSMDESMLMMLSSILLVLASLVVVQIRMRARRLFIYRT